MADTLDVLTLAEGRTAVGITAADSLDGSLEPFITAVSRELDDLCGPVVNRTITDELHDGGTPNIDLRVTPVASITSVNEYIATNATTLTAETNASKPTAGYLHDGTFGTLQSGRLIRRTSGTDATFTAGRRNVAVTYVAGRAAATASVDERFKAAASIMLRHKWTGTYGSGTSTFPGGGSDYNFDLGPGLLNKVAAILGDEMQSKVMIG